MLIIPANMQPLQLVINSLLLVADDLQINCNGKASKCAGIRGGITRLALKNTQHAIIANA